MSQMFTYAGFMLKSAMGRQWAGVGLGPGQWSPSMH